MRRSWFNKHLSDSVVVQCKDGAAIRGFLRAVYREELVLDQAKVVGLESDAILAGTTGIPRSNVSFVYLVTPETP